MAIWREHEFNFTYRSAYPTHSCHDLQSLVALVLVALDGEPSPTLEDVPPPETTAPTSNRG